MTPTESSVPSKLKSVRPVARSLSSVGNVGDGQTICEKSLAIGTLGYRILCEPNKKAQRAQLQEKQRQQTHEKKEQEVLAKVSSRSTMTTTGDASIALDFPEAEASELRRLKNLFEQLNKHGKFRPIVNAF